MAGDDEGRRREAAPAAADAGPTLDQCLVLPKGLALKIDGLLSAPLSELVEDAREGGGGGGRVGGGGEEDGGGLDQVVRIDGRREEPPPRAEVGEGGLGGGEDRPIISMYAFEVSVFGIDGSSVPIGARPTIPTIWGFSHIQVTCVDGKRLRSLKGQGEGLLEQVFDRSRS